MGIPSYYKKLVDTVPGLVTKGRPAGGIEWLFMDFNCLIYHCLHRSDTPAYPGDLKKAEWEGEFIECIVAYCLKVIKEVAPQKGVFIAIDGVVPMAKMRQQRLRRFKSVWLTQHPVEPTEATGPTWDRNAITPGTDFMKKLRTRLEQMISKHGKKSWILSSSDEPGEGEHKIISQWRKGGGELKGMDFAVYGLDADLIVLSILGQQLCELKNNIWLFREEVSSGKISYNSDGEEIFEWFSIDSLKAWLGNGISNKGFEKEFILNYCFAMSILGNDFLPSSLGFKIRDDGHSELLEIIREFVIWGQHLVNIVSLEVSLDNVLELFNRLAGDEEVKLQKSIYKKQRTAQNLGVGPNAELEIKIGDNNWPLAKIEESVLVNSKCHLLPNWRELYMEHFFNGFTYNTKNIGLICSEYLYGIQWIWAYYTGQESDVCFNWFYPFTLPPLWQWLRDYLKESRELPEFPGRVLVRAGDIKPVEQLALVLPLESWDLIPAGPEKMFPILAPQYFPSAFSFESVGKRYFWECESMIPVPSIVEFKHTVFKLATSS